MPSPLVQYRLSEKDEKGRVVGTRVVSGLNASLDFIQEQFRKGIEWDFQAGSQVPIIVESEDGRQETYNLPGEAAIPEITNLIRSGLRFGSDTFDTHNEVRRNQELRRWGNELRGNAAGAFAAGAAGGPLLGAVISRAEGFGADPEVAQAMQFGFQNLTEGSPWAYGAGQAAGLVAGAVGPGAIARAGGWGAARGLGQVAATEALAGGLAGMSSAAGRLASAGIGRALPGAMGRIAARGLGETVAEPLLARAIGGALEGGLGAAGYIAADRMAKNERLFISDIIADASPWALVGGMLPVAGAGLAAARRAWSGTPGARIMNASREELANSVINVRKPGLEAETQVAEHLLLSERGAMPQRFTTGSAAADRVAEILGKRAVLSKDEVIALVSPTMQAVARRTLDDIAQESGEALSNHINAAFKQFDEISIDQIPLERISSYSMEDVGIAQSSINAFAPIQSALNNLPLDGPLAAWGARGGGARGILERAAKAHEPAMERAAWIESNGSRLLPSTIAGIKQESYERLITVHNDLGEEVLRLNKAGENAAASELRTVRDGIRGAIDDEATWGEAARAEAPRRQMFSEILDVRDSLNGRAPRGVKWSQDIEAARLMSGNRVDRIKTAALLKRMASPEGQSEMGFLSRRLEEMKQSITKHGELLQNPAEMLTAINEARNSLLNARNLMVNRRAFERIRAASPSATPSDAAAAVGGFVFRSLPAYLLIKGALGLRKWMRNPIDTMSLIKNAGANSVATTQRVVNAQASIARVLSRTVAYGVGTRATALGVVASQGSRESKRKEFEAISSHLRGLAARPQAMLDHVEMSASPLAGLSEAAPLFASQYLSRFVVYLNSQLPVQVANPLDPTRMLPPSMADVDAFMVKFAALQDPYSLMESVASGRGRTEAAEAVKTVFPEIYATQALAVSDTIAEHTGPIDYQAKLQLAIFFGIPDATLAPAFQAAMQSKAAQTQNQAQSIASVRRPVTIASSQQQSATQSLQERS